VASGNAPEEFARVHPVEIEKLAKILKQVGAKPE